MTDAEMINAILTMAVISATAFAAVARISIARHERHERVLLPFEDIRRELMDIVLAPCGEYSRREYAAARFLLAMVNGIISHYHPHKAALFNLRAIRRDIEKDLRRYRQIQAKVRAQIADLPDNAKIRKAYHDFVIATTDAYVANTPFIRAEVVLRLFGRGLAEQVKAARQSGEQVINEMEGKPA